MIVEKETPKIEGFSNEFNDLIAKLLEKDPIKRMNWEELKRHPFWKSDPDNFSKSFTKRFYPEQPQFDAYLRTVRNINPEGYKQQRMNLA